jgi:hypothetical protein
MLASQLLLWGWANLASHNAGVTVVIVGISNHSGPLRRLYWIDESGETIRKDVENINGYLVAGDNVEVVALGKPPDSRAEMQFGNHTYYGVDLLLTRQEAGQIVGKWPGASKFIRPFLWSQEVISGLARACLWINDSDVAEARQVPLIEARLQKVAIARPVRPTTGPRRISRVGPINFEKSL